MIYVSRREQRLAVEEEQNNCVQSTYSFAACLSSVTEELKQLRRRTM